MGYLLTAERMDEVVAAWARDYSIYAPVLVPEGGPYSDDDVVRYGEVSKFSEIVLDRKSGYSFKEFLLPLSQTLFFFTEEAVKEADIESRRPKGAIIFLRSCDLHAVERLDEIYLRNRFEDYYYKRLREHVKFVVLGCAEAWESCFCVDMETNRSDDYDAALGLRDGGFYVDNRNPEWNDLFAVHGESGDGEIPFVSDTPTRVSIPEDLSLDVTDSKMWDEYDARCINCGRCNFACPTCTCFTMQDVFYTDNGRVGERRRVWASCMVDGYTDVAGGGSYRKGNGQRMRFKNLHKIYDYKKRFDCHMCVGCGRCDDVCPEYISFSGSINKLEGAMREIREVKSDGGK